MADITNDTSLAIRKQTTMDPTPEESADGSILVKVLAAVLERLVNSNRTTARSDPGQLTKFHALKPPGIGVEAYLDRYVIIADCSGFHCVCCSRSRYLTWLLFSLAFRVHKYASCSNECFILALIYVDRLIERNNFLLTELNVHRVVITAILLAAKFFDDAYYNNAYYAKVGGVLVSELNGLEVDFLFRINFSLHVQPEVFEKYKAELVSHAINSGLIPVAAPVMDSASASHSVNQNEMGNLSDHHQQIEQQQQQQQQGGMNFPMDTANHDQSMNVTSHVGPSPPDLMEDTSHMTDHMVHQAQTSLPEATATAEFVAVNGANNTKPFETCMRQEDQQSLLLQRANSLPPLSSSKTGNDPSFKLPYSAPTMPSSAPVMAVDHVQYQLVVNQIFPIENTLVHHNHQGVSTTAATMQDHHPNAAAGLVSHHHGLGGPTGISPMAYQVSWSGQIR